jgi:DnaJ-class molecular chaperone
VEESQREKAEEVFKEIKQAYEILSDGMDVYFEALTCVAEKRQMYDRYGMLPCHCNFLML